MWGHWARYSTSGFLDFLMWLMETKFCTPQRIMRSIIMESELSTWGIKDQTLIFSHEKGVRNHEQERCLMGSGMSQAFTFVCWPSALSWQWCLWWTCGDGWGESWECQEPGGSFGGHSKARERDKWQKLVLKRTLEILVYCHVFHLQFSDLTVSSQVVSPGFSEVWFYLECIRAGNNCLCLCGS